MLDIFEVTNVAFLKYFQRFHLVIFTNEMEKIELKLTEILGYASCFGVVNEGF